MQTKLYQHKHYEKDRVEKYKISKYKRDKNRISKYQHLVIFRKNCKCCNIKARIEYKNIILEYDNKK